MQRRKFFLVAPKESCGLPFSSDPGRADYMPLYCHGLDWSLIRPDSTAARIRLV